MCISLMTAACERGWMCRV